MEVKQLHSTSRENRSLASLGTQHTKPDIYNPSAVFYLKVDVKLKVQDGPDPGQEASSRKRETERHREGGREREYIDIENILRISITILNTLNSHLWPFFLKTFHNSQLNNYSGNIGRTKALYGWWIWRFNPIYCVVVNIQICRSDRLQIFSYASYAPKSVSTEAAQMTFVYRIAKNPCWPSSPPTLHPPLQWADQMQTSEVVCFIMAANYQTRWGIQIPSAGLSGDIPWSSDACFHHSV